MQLHSLVIKYKIEGFIFFFFLLLHFFKNVVIMNEFVFMLLWDREGSIVLNKLKYKKGKNFS